MSSPCSWLSPLNIFQHVQAEKEAERLAVLMEAAARPVSTKRPREVFVDEFEDSEAQESDGEQISWINPSMRGDSRGVKSKKIIESRKDCNQLHVDSLTQYYKKICHV